MPDVVVDITPLPEGVYANELVGLPANYLGDGIYDNELQGNLNPEAPQLVVTINNPGSVEDIQRILTGYDDFRQGEKGIIEVTATGLDKIHDLILGWVDGFLESKGVTLWQPSTLSGDTLGVYFVTGNPAAVVVYILVAGLVAMGIAWVVMRELRLSRASEKQVDAEIARRDSILTQTQEAIKNLPADQQVKALNTLVDKEWAASPTQEENPVSETAQPINWTLIGLGLLAVAAILAIAVFKK